MNEGSERIAVALAAAVVVMVGGISPGRAQGVGFLSEQQQLASYCAGVTETRLRELGDFIKRECAASKRKECVDAGSELGRVQALDRRLWDYLMTEIFATRDQGPRERALAEQKMAKGSDDWTACNRRPRGTSGDDLRACRESRGCLIDSRFSFLPP